MISRQAGFEGNYIYRFMEREGRVIRMWFNSPLNIRVLHRKQFRINCKALSIIFSTEFLHRK